MGNDAIRDILVHLAPELRGLRVFFATAVPAFVGLRSIRGLALPFLSAAIAPHLPPGPAIFLHDDILQDEGLEYAADADLPPAEAIRRVFLAVAVHELAHVLDYPPPHFTAPSAAVDVAAVAAALERLPVVPPPGDVPWAGHGPSWVRCVVHLRHRLAARLGLRLSLTQILHDSYGIGHPDSFALALGDEPERCVGMPFDAILAMPLPPAFSRLWYERTKDFTASAEVLPVATSAPGHSDERTFHMAASTTIAPSPPPKAKTRAELEALIARRPAIEAELLRLAEEEAGLPYEELSQEQADIRLRRIGRRRHALNDQLHAAVDAETALRDMGGETVQERRREINRQCAAIEKEMQACDERIDRLRRVVVSYRVRAGDPARIARAEQKIADAQAERQRLLDQHHRLQADFQAPSLR